MKVRIHLVVEDTGPDLARDRRVEMKTVVESGAAYGSGQSPVIGAIRAAADLTVAAVKELRR